MATGTPGVPRRTAGRRLGLRSGPRGMRREEAAVAPAGAAREAGGDGGQPGQPGGGPQQPCGQGVFGRLGVCLCRWETRRRRSRLPAGSPTQDWIPGPRDHGLGRRQTPNRRAPGDPFHGLLFHSPCALQVYRKKFLYSEPHKRIKEVLEEELYIKRDECHIKNPPAVALERIWSIKRNLPVGSLKPGLPSRNSLLPQTTYYSRHGGLRR
ncbi:uncharacterized protein C11orf97 homolog [Vulpes lagopus]|uniref:uncharacterized protein C11orf97 homolog n=1 Tax=Vulpes lagopus TaxID=494514 RepID=UPI001BC9D251|nr:uncharacterized protein C11orf97 homolog [Vulpes lagopus]